MAKLGAVKCTNWVYFNPITTIIVAWFVLDEQITLFFLVGSLFILSGMYMSGRKKLK